MFPDVGTLGVAIVGALAGSATTGYVAYKIQDRAFKEAEKTRQKELRNTQQVQGRSLILKMMKIHSDILMIDKHLKTAFQAAKSHETTMEPWGFVKELATLPRPVHYSYDELSTLMSLGDDEVFNAVLNAEPVHANLLALVNALHSYRRELLEKLPVTTTMGTLASAEIDPESLAPLRLQMNAVNEIIDQLCQFVERGRYESQDALRSLCDLLREKLDMQHRVEIPE